MKFFTIIGGIEYFDSRYRSFRNIPPCLILLITCMTISKNTNQSGGISFIIYIYFIHNHYRVIWEVVFPKKFYVFKSVFHLITTSNSSFLI